MSAGPAHSISKNDALGVIGTCLAALFGRSLPKISSLGAVSPWQKRS